MSGPNGLPARRPPAVARGRAMAQGAVTMIESRIEPHDALSRLADWGFIATSDLPDKPGPASLLIALREKPTLAHYDPERVEFWATRGERGVHVTVTRETPMPVDAVFSWGLIRIADRLGVTNEYAAFGGHVAAELVDGVVVVVFTSPAPILRRGGHTQGWDPGATSIVAFFSRLLVAVDFRPGFEAQIADAEPLARYAAFLQDVIARYRVSSALRDGEPDVWRLFSADAKRVERDHPDVWAAGARLIHAADGPTAITRPA